MRRALRHPGHSLRANVQFHTALLLSALELRSTRFSLLFACARCASSLAHAAEQQRCDRLIRPAVYDSGERSTRRNARPLHLFGA